MKENFVLEMARGINPEQRKINLFCRRVDNANVTHRALIEVFQGAISLKNSLGIQVPDDEFLRAFGFIIPRRETLKERTKGMNPVEKEFYERLGKSPLYGSVSNLDCLSPSDSLEELRKIRKDHWVCKMPPGAIPIIEVTEEETKFIVPTLDKKKTERWLDLLWEENQIVKGLVSEILKARETQFELTSSEYIGGRNSEESSPIFELELPNGERLEVDNPHVVLKETILDYIYRIGYRSTENFNGFLDKVKEFRISTRARCPDIYAPRKIARISCKKYEDGDKDGINNYHKCASCILERNGFDSDGGTNFEGYKPLKVNLRQVGTKI